MHLAREELWLCSFAPAGNQIYCPIGHQIWGPLGKQNLCPNFALTAAKFVFSNSGNLNLGQRQISQSPYLALNAHSGNEWRKIPVLTRMTFTAFQGVAFTVDGIKVV